MSARRSTRLRRKPTPIYQVEDARGSDDEVEAQAEEQDAMQGHEKGEESSSEGPEGEDEEFTPSGTKLKKPANTRKAARTPLAKARVSRRKRSPWSQARSLGLARRERKSKRKGAETEAETETAGNDAEHEDDGESLFEAIKKGKASLENLLSEWRDRFEEEEEKATREVLNLVLQACGGTGQCVPESEPLAQLDMSDLVNHVVEDLEKGNGEYPMVSRGKGMKKFQRNFEEFWEVFVKECNESEILFTSEIATNFIDWLTSLSSSEIRPIRHTTTVAVLTLSNSLVRTAATISEKLAIATRQLIAETNSPGKATPGTHKSPNIGKMALLKENKTLYENRLEQVLKLVNLVFTGVVVHRYRDVMPEIRVVSMQCLGHWITTLPDQFLKDSFLKYLGWLLSDKSASVRLEVVEILCELYGNDAFTEKLELFTSRFLPRYLELCNDVDDAVVEECIHLLIAVDKHSLISSDIELQPVEKLVFDAEHEEIRKAAAEFVCLQYEAFGVAVSKTKNEKLKKEQLNTQAIALVEFAEEYIQNHGVPEGAVETLVDAFWGLDDCLVLQDWRLMTDLILVDKSAPDLSSEQQTILMRLLVASVSKLVGDGASRGTSATAKKESEQLQEEITVAYCKDIPSLFLLYQSDPDKLALLLQLIPMLTLKSEVIGHHSSHIKELLEKLKRAYLLHSDDELLTSLALSITHLVRTEHASLKREAEVIVRELVQEVLDKIDRLLEADMKLCDTLAISGDGTPKTKSKKTRGRKKKGAKAKEISDIEYGLRIGMRRLKCLVRYLNVREYMPPDLASSAVGVPGQSTVPELHLGRMDRLAVAIGDLLRRRTKCVTDLDEGFQHADTIKHGLIIIYSDLLWITAPIFKNIEDDKKRDSTSAESGDADDVDPSVSVQIKKICHSRFTLEEALISVLEMHLARTQGTSSEEHKENTETPDPQSVDSMEELEFEDADVAAYVREAQRFAFLTFCDARCLFVEKFQDATAPYNSLEWALPSVLDLLTEMHFQAQMNEAEEEEPEFEDEMVENDPTIVKEKEDAIREWEEKQQRKAELLVALGRVSLCNPSKKGQAAAVLQYFTSSGKPGVEVVKAFGKLVKTDTPVRYLEIQMTALRDMFSSILIWKQDLEAAASNEKASNDEASELEELKEKLKDSEQELKELAKRFSQSLGVGKVPLSLRAPFLRFLCEGVRYSLEQPVQFGFLETMRIYLSHLDNSSMAQLREYFMERLHALSDIPGDAEALDPQWRALFDFQSAVTSTGIANGRKQASTGVMLSPPLRSKRRSASSEPTSMQTSSIAEEDDEDNSASEQETDAKADGKTDVDKTEDDEQDETYVDCHTRHEPSGRKRAAATVDNASSPLRKRPRAQHHAGTESSPDTKSNELSADEAKSEDDAPVQSNQDDLSSTNLKTSKRNRGVGSQNEKVTDARSRRKRRQG
ncbi:hypothetical protein PRNP1_010669 [Phytophthora ramorum]